MWALEQVLEVYAASNGYGAVSEGCKGVGEEVESGWRKVGEGFAATGLLQCFEPICNI